MPEAQRNLFLVYLQCAGGATKIVFSVPKTRRRRLLFIQWTIEKTFKYQAILTAKTLKNHYKNNVFRYDGRSKKPLNNKLF